MVCPAGYTCYRDSLTEMQVLGIAFFAVVVIGAVVLKFDLHKKLYKRIRGQKNEEATMV